VLQRLARFGAETANSLVGVVAGECGQVHAGNRAKEPCDLPIFLNGAARDKSGGAALDGAGVYANAFDPIEIERSAAIWLKWTASQRGDGARRFGDGMTVAVDNVESRRIFRIHGKAPGKLTR